MKIKPVSLSLVRFTQACQQLRKSMQHNVILTEAERLKFENHLILVEMGYAEWKARNNRERTSAACR